MHYRRLLLAAAAAGTATGYAPAGAWRRPQRAPRGAVAAAGVRRAAVAAPWPESTPARRQVALAASPSDVSGISEAVFAADERPVILFDGVCNLCNEGVNFVLDWDAQSKFRYAALQSRVGAALLARCGRESDDISTIVLVTKDGFFDRSSAVVKIGAGLSAPLNAAALAAQLCPKFLRDPAYDLVSKTRYRIFGEAPMCRLGDDKFDALFVSDEAMLAAAAAAAASPPTNLFLAVGGLRGPASSALAAAAGDDAVIHDFEGGAAADGAADGAAAATGEDESALDKMVESMTNFSNQYCKNTGTYYCSEPSVPSVVIRGLAEHKLSLGAPLCPCRHYEDKEAEAKSGYWNCPCVPMRERHDCHCMLFLTDENEFSGPEQSIAVEEVRRHCTF